MNEPATPTPEQIAAARQSAGRPGVKLPAGQRSHPETAAELGKILAARGDFFARGGSLAWLIDGELRIISRGRQAVSAFESAAQFIATKISITGGAVSYTDVPSIINEKIAGVLLEAPQLLAPLPVVHVIAKWPVLIERDGRLIHVDGFD